MIPENDEAQMLAITSNNNHPMPYQCTSAVQHHCSTTTISIKHEHNSNSTLSILVKCEVKKMLTVNI
jgi:hypothetical protein